jgi:hypothetical protein
MHETEATFATRCGIRLPLAPVIPGRLHVHLPASSRAGVGVITSRRQSAREFWELAAFRAGCTIEEAKRRAQA